MNRKAISARTACGISAMLLAFLAVSANAQTATAATPESDKAALVDEAPAPEAPAPAPVQAPAKPVQKAAPEKKAEAKEPAAATQAPATCDPAPAKDSGSKIPVFPIILSSIATIAFVVLAIIF